MRAIITILIMVLSVFQGYSQNPSITWQKTIGGIDTDSGQEILKHDESDALFLIGSSYSDISGEKSENSKGGSDIWLLKTNNDGTVLWDKTIGGSELDGQIISAQILDSKLYILATSASPISGDRTAEHFGTKDYWLLCLDLEGNILWDMSYGGLEDDIAYKLSVLRNGNLLVAGKSRSAISGNKTSESKGESDYWILEINPDDGEIIKQKSFGSSGIDELFNCAIDDLGNIYLIGMSAIGVSGDKSDEGYGSTDYWMVKIDQDFNLLEDKCFGGSEVEYPRGDLLIQNDFIYLFADSESPISGNKTAPLHGRLDYWLIKMDLNFNVIWDKTFGGNSMDYAQTLLYQSFNKLVLIGSSQSLVSGNKTAERFGPSEDIWIVIVDEDGNEIKQECYGGELADSPSSAIGEDDGNIYVFGGSESNISGVKTEDSRGEYDFWLLYLDGSDFLRVTNTEQPYLINAYPNPFSDKVRFK